jgi:cellulose biosynthesis protein BcsQ
MSGGSKVPALSDGGGANDTGSMSGGSKVPALSDGGGANDTTSVDAFDDFSEPRELSSFTLRARRHQPVSVRPLPYKKRPAADGGGAARAAAGDVLSGTGSGCDANGGVVVDRLLRNGGGGDTDGVTAAPAEAGAHRKCTRIATFMFKGGVYKTMTTVLTASALAAAPYNKRVLIVDADSQCNATSFFTPEPVDWQDDHKPPVAQESQGGEGGGGGAGAAGGMQHAKGPSKISLSEPGLECPRTDPLGAQFFKSDTWLSTFDGKKINTIFDVLEPEFDHGVREMKIPDIIPVTHIQKKTDNNSAKFDARTQVICQNCGDVRTKPDKKFRASEWLCSDKCADEQYSEHLLFLLPGSTKMSRLESRMSDNLEQGGQQLIWESFDHLFNQLAQNYALDYIFVDLGPNHGKLNMAFALNCDAILPPLHADFYSATSMCRMLEDKGVLSQWDAWRCKVDINK